MRGQRTSINLRPGARLADALGDVEDDARKAILVDPDLLVVGDLSQLAVSASVSHHAAGDGCRKQGCLVPNVRKLLGKVADDGAAKKGRAMVFGHVEAWSTVGAQSCEEGSYFVRR